MFYVLRSGCQWRLLPLIPLKMALRHHYFRAWRIDGTWEKTNQALRQCLQVRPNVGPYAPNLDPVVYDVTMDPEEFGGLCDRHVLLRRLVGLCALCTPFAREGGTRPSGAGRLALRSLPDS